MKRGEVYRFNLDSTIGSDMQKLWLCVIVMHDPKGNSPVTIACPVSDATDARGIYSIRSCLRERLVRRKTVGLHVIKFAPWIRAA